MRKVKRALKNAALFILNRFSCVLWFLVYVFFSFLILNSFEFVPPEIALAICFVLYAVSVLIAALFGEKILKIVHNVRPPETKKEIDYLYPLFEAVYHDVKKKYPQIPKIKPFVVDSLAVNSFAIGNHTVAITKGALNTFSEEELQGIIAHEIAHIHYGDTTVNMINQIGNGFFSVYIVLVNLFFSVLDLFFHFDDPDLKHTGGLLRALVFFLRFALTVSVYILLFIGNILLAGHNRKNEFRADWFAHKVGHGRGLTDALYILQDMSLGEKLRFVERMQEHHPRVSMRIGKLEKLEGVL